MQYKLLSSLILLLIISYSKLLQSEESRLNAIETGEYCECMFFSEEKSPFKITIGWPGIQDEPLTSVIIDGKNYKNIKKQYEKFKPELNSKGDFLLSNELISLKGNLTVTSDCRKDGGPSGVCESTKFKGNLSVKISGKTENHKITGGCGC